MAVWMWRVTKREKSRLSKTNRQMVVPSTETGTLEEAQAKEMRKLQIPVLDRLS